MNQKSSSKLTPLQKIEKIYGKEKKGATIKQCASKLRKMGYQSLANLLEVRS